MATSVLMPIDLSVFMLNCAVVDDPSKPANWCVGPLGQMQPDYSRLARYDNEVQEHVDCLHMYTSSATNPRIRDAGSKALRQSRIGVHLHWHLPQLYRAAVEIRPEAEAFKKEAFIRGYRTIEQRHDGLLGWGSGEAQASGNEQPTCLYRVVPNRWLIMRWIDTDTVLPEEARPFVNKFEVFLIESDRCRNISDLGSEIDLEVDVSPFVEAHRDVEEQADIFIGCKYGPGAEKPPKKRPRDQYVPLSVFNSSNPYFPDFQPHNNNVFSMVDTFSYKYNQPDGASAIGFMKEATASYTVFGWVDDKELDIFADETITHAELLKKLKLQLLDEKVGSDTEAWLSDNAACRAVCHASIYDVRWSADHAPQNMGHRLAQNLQSRLPVSVGSTPLDSFRALSKRDPAEIEDPQKSDALDILSDTVYEIETYTPDTTNEATSEIAKRDRALLHAFARSTPGVMWRLTDLNAQTAETGNENGQKSSLSPTGTQQLSLVRLRVLQAFRDACAWELKQLQWDLFAQWWKLKTSEKHMSHEQVQGSRVLLSENVIDRLVSHDMGQLKALLAKLDSMLDPEEVKKVSPEAQKTPDESFFQRKEPTVTVPDCKPMLMSSAPGPLGVRLSSQVVKLAGSAQDPQVPFDPKDEQKLNDCVARAIDLLDPKPDGSLYMTIGALTREWYLLRNDTVQPVEDIPAPFVYPPQNGRSKSNGKREGDDVWNGTQTFNAVFAEWEATYFHIPYEKWSLRPSDADGVRWDLNEYIGRGYAGDARTVSGRDLVLPQIRADFHAMAGSWADPVDNYMIAVCASTFPSFALTGVRDHLTTRFPGGTHLMPNAVLSGVSSSAVAQHGLAEPAFTQNEVVQIETQTQETPYAGTVNVDSPAAALGHPGTSPFKPVLHGQMVLTKLNIVDEFGQIISAVDFDKPPTGDILSRAIYPYVSDGLACSTLVNPHGDATKIANAVVGDQDNRCSFFQIPPSINQPARLNACFVTTAPIMGHNAGSEETYRPIYEQWENPVWGWVLVNYASHGIQFFLPDGKFFGQVQLGGRAGTNIPVQWQPFEEPPDVNSIASANVDTRRLHELIETFRAEPTYLKEFIHMIGASLIASPDAGPSYSESLASVTGRCLALVDFGISLELAQRPKKNESTINSAPPELALEDYEFPCIFGDEDHRYDGLVGYFAPPGGGSASRKPDFTTCFTNFPSPGVPDSSCKTTRITSENAPRVKPYYIQPLDISDSAYEKADGVVKTTLLEKLGSAYGAAQAEKLHIFTALINPYSPVHIRTGGLLPTKTLQLAPWTIKAALESIDVFFPAGPILALADPLRPPQPQSPSAARVAKSSGTVANEKSGDVKTAEVKVQIPTPAGNAWTWKQPKLSGAQPQTTFADFRTAPFANIREEDVLRENQARPLTALEGYLCLNLENERAQKIASRLGA